MCVKERKSTNNARSSAPKILLSALYKECLCLYLCLSKFKHLNNVVLCTCFCCQRSACGLALRIKKNKDASWDAFLCAGDKAALYAPLKPNRNVEFLPS